MNYISKYTLISAIYNNSGGLLDRKALLSTVDRNLIFKKIKSKYADPNITDDFFITEEPIEEEHWSKLPDQVKKYIDVLFETREKFPDYLFGKISLAEYYLSLNVGYKSHNNRDAWSGNHC